MYTHNPNPNPNAGKKPPGGPNDGPGADHDEEYKFGRRPRLIQTYPFSTQQYGRLLRLRGLIRDQNGQDGDTAADPKPNPGPEPDDSSSAQDQEGGVI